MLESIQALAFVNPFANERDEIEGKIISRMGWAENLQDMNSKFTNEFNQVLHWVREGEQFLLMGKDNKLRSVLRAEQKASLAYFSLFHELIDDLDSLIESLDGQIRLQIENYLKK